MTSLLLAAEGSGEAAHGAATVVVTTAKELTPEDHLRLNGGVERIVQKHALDHDALLQTVRDLVSAHTRAAQART